MVEPTITIVHEWNSTTRENTGRSVHALRSGDFIVHDGNGDAHKCDRSTLQRWAFDALVNSGFYR